MIKSVRRYLRAVGESPRRCLIVPVRCLFLIFKVISISWVSVEASFAYLNKVFVAGLVPICHVLVILRWGKIELIGSVCHMCFN